ncbi:MAG TPA: 16S rRNA (guanine(966)-N(2))-methyltransferase RsmD [Bacteroidales bacterium]
MRIIGGQFSKRLIHPPKNLPVRPTTDLAKESLFNILRNKTDFHGKNALDLFSGTGSLAYEFASRHCEKVVAVDLNFQCVHFIKKTANEFGMQNLSAVRSEVFRYIKTTPFKFDIIFADPPYQMEEIPLISKLVFEYKLLNENGIMIIEHPKEVDFSKEEHFSEHRKYGQVNFSFFTL